MSAGIIGIITSIATGILKKTMTDPVIDKYQLDRDIDKAITTAVEFTHNRVARCFTRKHGALDESFWGKEEVAKELWGTFVDRRNPQRIPDFNKLYKTYCDIWTPAARMERLLFDQAMETFWTYFLQEAKNSAILSKYYLEKLHYLHDDTVYPYEARQMIAVYCRRVFPHLEKQIFNIFNPKELAGSLSEQQVREEFFDYQRTRLTYVTYSQEEAARDDITAEGNSFHEHERVIFIGDGGVGKSRFLRELECELVKDIADNAEKAEYLPIYLEADSFNDYTLPYLHSMIIIKLKKAFQADERLYEDNKIEGFIRCLFMYRTFHPLIDAFDQTRPANEANVFTILSEEALFGKGRCYVSLRPYSLDYLLSGINDKGGDISNFVIMRLHSFDPKELKQFFKGYYHPYIDELNYREGLINVVQIPMLARLVKIMTIKGRFTDTKFQRKMCRTEILKEFVDYVIEEQSKKDKALDKNILKRRNDYLALLPKLKELSLKTMIAGEIYRFPRSYAEGVLGDALDRAETIEFICPFIDYEHEIIVHREKYHRYQHQIFQEFFTSWRLYELYIGGKKDELLESLNKLTLPPKEQPQTYMPEVGHFFAEMVEVWCENEERDFTYWQNLLMEPETDDWARTYALQVRDKLGASKAKGLLDNLFAEENRMLNHSSQQTQYVQITAGPFISGSYEHNDEQPVRLIFLEAYEIARYPVTNSEFKRFLDSWTTAGKAPDGEGGQKIFYPEDGKIYLKTRSFLKTHGFWITQGYEKHPVTGIISYWAQAFCAWLSQQDGKNWGIPSELEWEKASRGCLGRRYPWGNVFDKEKCNTRESGENGTTLMERYSQGRSPYGCHDMAGNVWEWTYSPYGKDVLRGGSWYFEREFARCTFRSSFYPGFRNFSVGFRCSRTLK